MKYKVYLNILDQIIKEAPQKFARYRIEEFDSEKLNQARSRASIHLFLKVSFGLLDFEERERVITDGSYDGGIDGYYIDQETKCLYLLQAKFRTNETNFEQKEITLEELLSMDINRILEGENFDENGNEYNGKIKQLQREVSQIDDIARYTYKVIVLANLSGISLAKLKLLSGGYPVDVFDAMKTYENLVFPVISGTYFTASDISIPIDLSNKNAGAKISYTVNTKASECEITALFVPTIELAKMMTKYKNSILKFNPRSYLDLEGRKVNSSIRETILNKETNEFALYNNGITMLSDETYINERIGQKNRAQLRVKNPQIINGGQTTYTLSRIYEENKDGDLESIFGGKEVLLKVITLMNNSNDEDKLNLIDDISNATNQQTPVINADRFANESFHKAIQKKIFDRYGILYERKRGEFSDGILSGYIEGSVIVERNQFFRIYYSANGHINLGSQKKLFQQNRFPNFDINNNDSLDRFYVGYYVFSQLLKDRKPNIRLQKDTYAKIYAYNQLFFKQGMDIDPCVISENISILDEIWGRFVEYVKLKTTIGNRAFVDKITGEAKSTFSENRLYRSGNFEKTVVNYFTKIVKTPEPLHNQ
ncbi:MULTISPECIES: AIPR family protein [unclassified Serratia (in: enterobacteria)]|uniref:AIPR family protein n=1 Tax=unclassified Serratia (in: enterobacteria) TaxID=2647522 RepID=UPI00068C1DEC|nr:MULTISPECIES: AIPR family protein [unclassified Serratia (in: enterobacteria)]